PRRALAAAIANNPFPRATDDHKSLHLYFMAAAPKQADRAAMDALLSGREAYAIAGKVLYLHTPAGFGTSKLATRIERLLGVAATARNWRTVTTLAEMAKA